MPKSVYLHAMVRLGDVLVVVGGMGLESDDVSDLVPQSALHSLKCSDHICKWSTMNQRLAMARVNPVAMAIPDDVAVCT